MAKELVTTEGLSTFPSNIWNDNEKWMRLRIGMKDGGWGIKDGRGWGFRDGQGWGITDSQGGDGRGWGMTDGRGG